MDVQFVAIQNTCGDRFFLREEPAKKRGGPLPTITASARHGIAMPRGVVLAVMGRAYGTLKGSDPLKQFFCHF